MLKKYISRKNKQGKLVLYRNYGLFKIKVLNYIYNSKTIFGSYLPEVIEFDSKEKIREYLNFYSKAYVFNGTTYNNIPTLYNFKSNLNSELLDLLAKWFCIVVGITCIVGVFLGSY